MAPTPKDSSQDKPAKDRPARAIAPPKGTRDMYPDDALRRRYIEQAWRDVSIRHGFEEIHGPTFEQSDLYAVKSGEGILGELFQAFSGKAQEEIDAVRETGRAPFALRPEFTPTLARMYAAKANTLPKPCKWFTAGPYFRAERPQRGRLREFLQWNCDVIGLPGEDADTIAQHKAHADAEIIAVCADLMTALGAASIASVRMSDREGVDALLTEHGTPPEALERIFALLDRLPKSKPDEWARDADDAGLPATLRDALLGDTSDLAGTLEHTASRALPIVRAALGNAIDTVVDPRIVRGLAYYTGTVFELIAEGERAVAGGGRYDNLIELMGGPPTPAVGFAMGDVVLGLLLDDHSLMPTGAELMDAVSARPASVRPEAFVLSANDDETDALVRPLLAALRRGIESTRHTDSGGKPWHASRYEPATGGVRPLHARTTTKSTRNLKKLLADAEKQHARFAVVLHGPDRVQLKDLDNRKDLTPADVGVSDTIAEFSIDPASAVYVGRAIAART